jgi:hypothetical protein
MNQPPPQDNQQGVPPSPSSKPAPKSSDATSTSVKVVLITTLGTVLVAIITYIVAPIVIHKFSSTSTPTPVTNSSPTISPTLTPIDPQKLYDQITGSTPSINDSLSHNGPNNWDEEHTTTYSCTFVEGAYHASLQVTQNYVRCLAYATNLHNFTYQVQMMITKGDSGGILFRYVGANSANGTDKGYSFTIDQDGTYDLSLRGSSVGNLLNGSSPFIKTGPNQTNLIAIVADGSNIYLYVNHHYINRTSDTTYQSGAIGVLAENSTSSSAEVVFSKAQVWEPSS